MKKKPLPLILALTLLPFLIAGCTTEPLQSTDPGQEIIPVHSEMVIKGPFQTSIELSGRSTAVQAFPVLVPSAMKIDQVHASLGQQVSKGDLLLTFDQEQAKEHLETAKQQVQMLEDTLARIKAAQEQIAEQSQASTQEQQAQLERAQALLEGAQTGAVTILDLLQASTELLLLQNQMQSLPQLESLALNPAQIELQLEQAEAQVKLAEQSLEQLSIRAPFDGVITFLQAQSNQIAVPNSPLMQLSNMNEILIDLQISAAQINQLTTGMDVNVRFEGEDTVYSSTLSGLAPGTAFQSPTFQGQIYLPNTEHSIYPGKLAKVEVITSTEPNALLVPIEAVLFQESSPFVYVIKENRAQLQAVQIGQRNQQHYHVIDGLQEGDEVITSGKERVTDGRQVYIQK